MCNHDNCITIFDIDILNQLIFPWVFNQKSSVSSSQDVRIFHNGTTDGNSLFAVHRAGSTVVPVLIKSQRM